MGASQGILSLALLSCILSLKVASVSCAKNDDPPNYIKLSSMMCVGNPELLVNVSCRLKPINWDKSVAFLDSDLVGEIKNASLHIQLFKFTNQFRPFLLNLSLNLCDMLDTSKGNSYAKIVHKMLTKYTSINHGCPYEGHLGAHNLSVDPKQIPFKFPMGKYKMAFAFYEGWPYVHIGTVEGVAIVYEENPNQRARRKQKVQKSLHVRH